MYNTWNSIALFFLIGADNIVPNFQILKDVIDAVLVSTCNISCELCGCMYVCRDALDFLGIILLLLQSFTPTKHLI